MIRQLTQKDKLNFLDYCNRYGQKIFTDCSFKNLEKEFKLLFKYNKNCLIDEENEKLRGILFIEKINNEYYIKTIYKNSKILDRLLNILIWNYSKDLIFRINDYKIVYVLKKYFFRFKEKIENDYVYFRKYFKKVNKNERL